jgi:hypothetical protein
VGQIRSEAELKERGAEIYMDSVIYKDIAYQADSGFIAEKRVPGQTPEAKPAPLPAAPRPAAVPSAESAESPAAVTEPPAEKAKDADELSQFILDNLL